MSFNKAFAIFAVLLCGALAGCGGDLAREDERLSHPVAVEMKTLHASLLRSDPEPLRQDQLRRLAGEAQRRAAGPMVAAGGDSGWTHEVADQLRRFGAGTVIEQIDGPADAVVVDVPVWETRLPQCGQFDRGFNPDYDNAPNPNWGCSLQRNIAAMVQNPADLARSQSDSGRDANRASDVLDKYGRGAATGSAAESSDNGTSKVVDKEMPR